MNSGFTGADEFLMNNDYEGFVEMTQECEALSHRLAKVRRELWVRFEEIPGDFLTPSMVLAALYRPHGAALAMKLNNLAESQPL
jgi:hypothetical protein